MAAALAYTTTFSLPPLLLVVIAVAGIFFGREAVQGTLEQQIQGLIGSGVGEQVRTMLAGAGQNKSGGIVASSLGLLALLFGATAAFAQLPSALNRIWRVKPDPRSGGVKNFLTKRILSLGMALGIGFLLLVSLTLSAALAAFGSWMGGLFPRGISATILQALHFAVSFAVITALFAAMFKVLPDAEVEWRDVWAGAAMTSLLFTIGKFLIGYYLGKSGAASAYGAAGALVLIVLWIYYASMIVLMGAEFAAVWTEAHGREVRPKPGAGRVMEQQNEVRESDTQYRRAA